jgi:deoxyribodipyrimidine photo-lyase
MDSRTSMTRGIHWFRNDLRMHDNLALSALADRVTAWLPVFVIDPAMFARSDRSSPRARFLFDCLARLERDLLAKGFALQILEGKPEKLIPELMSRTGATVVSWNSASTPLGRRRNLKVASAISRGGGQTIQLDDHTVFGPDEIKTRNGGNYRVYTPYRNEWWKTWEREPRLSSSTARYPKAPIPKIAICQGRPSTFVSEGRSRIRLPRGGEESARRRLRKFLSGPASRYHLDRDRPDIDGTSRLSPYLRFGAISVRRCFTEGLRKIESDPRTRTGVSKWLDELIWREFYNAVLVGNPHVLSGAFRPEYDELNWQGSGAQFEAWCEGRTGYPIVDAGMRQLRSTGWIHNRVRMIVASFLTKDLLVDWRRGERFFFDSLVDGDPASNNGGWQWSASTGTDAQPYFRIFNPVAQGKKWDPDGKYVRRWVAELRRVDSRWIHAPWQEPNSRVRYIDPIVDHAVQRRLALDEFKRVRAICGRPRSMSEKTEAKVVNE